MVLGKGACGEVRVVYVITTINEKFFVDFRIAYAMKIQAGNIPGRNFFTATAREFMQNNFVLFATKERGGQLIYLQPLFHGGTLLDYYLNGVNSIQAYNCLPENQAQLSVIKKYYSLVVRIADALMEFHFQNKLHCDMKPGNMVVNASGRVAIIDFECMLENNQITNFCVWTPHYTSPRLEAAINNQPTGFRVLKEDDVFSFLKIIATINNNISKFSKQKSLVDFFSPESDLHKFTRTEREKYDVRRAVVTGGEKKDLVQIVGEIRDILRRGFSALPADIFDNDLVLDKYCRECGARLNFGREICSGDPNILQRKHGYRWLLKNRKYAAAQRVSDAGRAKHVRKPSLQGFARQWALKWPEPDSARDMEYLPLSSCDHQDPHSHRLPYCVKCGVKVG